jgi:hypothetical protein
MFLGLTLTYTLEKNHVTVQTNNEFTRKYRHEKFA